MLIDCARRGRDHSTCADMLGNRGAVSEYTADAPVTLNCGSGNGHGSMSSSCSSRCCRGYTSPIRPGAHPPVLPPLTGPAGRPTRLATRRVRTQTLFGASGSAAGAWHCCQQQQQQQRWKRSYLVGGGVGAGPYSRHSVPPADTTRARTCSARWRSINTLPPPLPLTRRQSKQFLWRQKLIEQKQRMKRSAPTQRQAAVCRFFSLNFASAVSIVQYVQADVIFILNLASSLIERRWQTSQTNVIVLGATMLDPLYGLVRLSYFLI